MAVESRARWWLQCVITWYGLGLVLPLWLLLVLPKQAGMPCPPCMSPRFALRAAAATLSLHATQWHCRAYSCHLCVQMTPSATFMGG